MRKTLCFFLVLCAIVVFPFPAFCANTISADVDDIISMIKSVISSEEGIYCEAHFNEKQNLIYVEIAFDGLATEVVYNCKKGVDPASEEWIVFQEAMMYLYDSLSTMLHIVGRDDLNLALSIVNDDAYIRQDYSTISYNPILAIRNGVVYIDIVKVMSTY